jgi:hypothetical protein
MKAPKPNVGAGSSEIAAKAVLAMAEIQIAREIEEHGAAVLPPDSVEKAEAEIARLEQRAPKQHPSKFRDKFFHGAGRSRIMDLQLEMRGAYNFQSDELLVREGDMTKFNRRNEAENKYFILTTKNIIYGKKVADDKITVDRVISLQGVVVKFPDESAKEPNGNYTFILLCAAKCFHLSARVGTADSDAEVKEATNSWFKDMKETITAEQVAKQGEALSDDAFNMWAVRKADAEAVKNCYRCTVEFGFFTRRHHCRKCGKPVCANCAKGKIMLPEDSEKRLRRVCDPCANNLKDKRRYGSVHESALYDDT